MSDDRVIFANRAAETMLGVGRMADLHKHLAREQGSWEFSGYAESRRDLRATSVRLKESRILTLVEDITETKLLDEVRRNFISNASHELKTPAAALLASSETVVNALADGEFEAASRFAGRLTSEAQRISRLVEDLLDLAKLEAPLPPNARVDLAQVIRAEAASHSVMAKRKGLQLHVDINDEAIVDGDPESLALLVRNLLDNAIRYTQQGEVSVGLSVTGSQSVIEVRDSGIGIPGSERVRIFERFYRVDQARSRETGGTGLGLSIVKNVAERHGGSVDVESEIGRGSMFLVTLPLS